MSIVLRIFDIGIITNLKVRGLAEKAKRQQWPYVTQSHSHGSPIHLYPLETLPDDIQIAWAGWTPERYKDACQMTDESDSYKSSRSKIPDPVSEYLAKQALGLPSRKTWYKPDAGDQKAGRRRKVYDGKSKGLCLKARNILLQRFLELAVFFAGNIEETLTMQESPNKYHLQENKTPKNTDNEMQREVPMLALQIKELKVLLQDCRHDKKHLQESLHYERRTFEQIIAEKDKTIASLIEQLENKSKPT